MRPPDAPAREDQRGLLVLASWFEHRSRVARPLIYAVTAVTVVIEAVATGIYGSEPLLAGFIVLYAVAAVLVIAAMDGLVMGNRNRP